MKSLVALGVLLVAGVFLTGCGEKQEASVAPDANVLKDAQSQPVAPKTGTQGGGIPAPTSSGLDPTK